MQLIEPLDILSTADMDLNHNDIGHKILLSVAMYCIYGSHSTIQFRSSGIVHRFFDGNYVLDTESRFTTKVASNVDRQKSKLAKKNKNVELA